MQPVEEEMSECLLDSDDEDIYPSSQDKTILENHQKLSPWLVFLKKFTKKPQGIYLSLVTFTFIMYITFYQSTWCSSSTILCCIMLIFRKEVGWWKRNRVKGKTNRYTDWCLAEFLWWSETTKAMLLPCRRQRMPSWNITPAPQQIPNMKTARLEKIPGAATTEMWPLETHCPRQDPLPQAVMKAIQLTSNRPGDEHFLAGCAKCLDQNNNECLHHIIWEWLQRSSLPLSKRQAWQLHLVYWFLIMVWKLPSAR